MKKNWYDNLRSDVGERLANCATVKSDLPELIRARWSYLVETGKAQSRRYTKEDALVYVLELLDCNSCFFDLTHEEYSDLIS